VVLVVPAEVVRRLLDEAELVVVAKLFQSPAVDVVLAVLVDVHLISKKKCRETLANKEIIRIMRGGGVGGVGGRCRITTGGSGGGAGA
jgi:hypothetical protein